MTFFEKFKRDHPDCPLKSKGIPYGCPEFYGYEDFTDCIVDSAADYYGNGCKKCWDREVPEEVNPNDYPPPHR